MGIDKPNKNTPLPRPTIKFNPDTGETSLDTTIQDTLDRFDSVDGWK